MAKVYLKALAAFTTHLGRGLVVGDPKHKDVRARYIEADEGPGVDKLVNGGKAERITLETYRKNTEGTELPDAGQVRVDQTAGIAGKVSLSMSTAQLQQIANDRGVDISKAKSRGDMVKAINKAQKDVSPEKAEGTDAPLASTASTTSDSTNHPADASPQSDNPGLTAPAADVVADEDAAPTGGGNAE